MRGLLALIALTLAAAPALAQESAADAQARVHFEAGRNYNETGDYEAAAREFERAYQLSHRPALLFNLYSVYERSGEFGRAADYLEQFLAADPNNADHDTLTARLQRLRERAAQGGTGGQVEGGGDTGGGSSSVDPFPIPAVVVTAIGAAALVSVAVLGGMAAGEDAHLDDVCGGSCTSEQVSNLNTLNVAADAMLAVGLVTVSAGIVLWVVLALSGGGDSSESAEPATEVAMAPWAGVGEGGLSVVGHFQ